MSTLVVRCDGHPNIRATHGKTIELTADDDVTARATCVLGVRASFDEVAATKLRGRLSIRFECGGVEQVVEATASDFYVGGDLVLRTGGDLRERTFGWGASAGSSDLDRRLVEALQQPGATLTTAITADDRSNGPGVLYVVGVPIGNAGDLSPRAVQVLQAVDLVLAEDTRYLRHLLRAAGIRVDELATHHAHNLASSTPAALERLLRGERLAFVSDAGMPGWSDPGEELVAAAVGAGVAVRPVPGPSAVTVAVAASGFPTHRVTFLGFLPRATGAKRKVLASAAGATVVCFESPRRLEATVRDIDIALPGARVLLAHELTKIHEELLTGTPAELLDVLADREVLGEWTVVIAPSEGEAPDDRSGAVDTEALRRLARELLDAGVSAKTITEALAASGALAKNAAKALVLELRNPRDR